MDVGRKSGVRSDIYCETPRAFRRNLQDFQCTEDTENACAENLKSEKRRPWTFIHLIHFYNEKKTAVKPKLVSQDILVESFNVGTMYSRII